MAQCHIQCFPNGVTAVAILGIISALAWGLGYFGQPHILTRFTSVKEVAYFKKATIIAMVWVVISLTAAVVIGLVAIPIWSGENALDAKEAERIFIYMVRDFFNPWLGGVLLAAILAAIMSTIDSQLLVSSSTLTVDFYKRILRKNAQQKELLKVSRAFVAVITIVALLLALADLRTIFGLVKFAWGGFGAAFGPVILCSLYCRKMSWKSALWGMIGGMLVMLGWYFAGLNAYLYELLPGFAANLAIILSLNHYYPETDQRILKHFDSVVRKVALARHPATGTDTQK